MMSNFEEIIKIIFSRSPLPALLAPPPIDQSKLVTSTPWNPVLHDNISQLEKDSKTPLLAIASLHLFNDDIGSCHDIVDKHGGHAIADYLHYLLHRREGDYLNARWWARQLNSQQFKTVYLSEKYNFFSNQKDVENLSSSAQLAEALKRAETFVDRCEQAEKGDNKEEKELLIQMQWDEMKTVFEFAQK